MGWELTVVGQILLLQLTFVGVIFVQARTGADAIAAVWTATSALINAQRTIEATNFKTKTTTKPQQTPNNSCPENFKNANANHNNKTKTNTNKNTK